MISEEAKKIANQCRHYAMCKIDYLGTGLCVAGKENHYVSYYPQGRMDIYKALANNVIPVTKTLVDIAKSCTLCGICDKQCHFSTELRPMKVMHELKNYVDGYLKDGSVIKEVPFDDLVSDLQKIVGEKWTSNDPAITVTYSDDPCPLSPAQLPRAVVLPNSQAEIQEIVKIAKKYNVPYIVRGNGMSVIGVVYTTGLIIDTNRMKTIEIDLDNWCATVGAGVSAFDLQKEVNKYGLRANVSEPSALVCANIMCSGIFSLFNNSYGTGADTYVNAAFVNDKGEIFNLNQIDAPNLSSYTKADVKLPGICTSASVKLHPMTEDEEGVLIPFSNINEALLFTRELSARRIGIALGLIGGEYLSAFISPTIEHAIKVKKIFTETLGVQYAVVVVGDKYDIAAISSMGQSVISNKLFRILILGLPNLTNDDWLDILNNLQGKQKLYEILCKEEMLPLIETALNSSPKTLAHTVPSDLKDFYTTLYSRPEITDIVWLNMFRIVSSRMGREKHFVPLIVYVPLDKPEIIQSMNEEFKNIADRYNIKNDFGTITPIDLGKRAIFEYDYYIDHTDQKEIEKVQKAVLEAGAVIEKYSSTTKGIKWIRYTLNQGCCRKENLLYI